VFLFSHDCKWAVSMELHPLHVWKMLTTDKRSRTCDIARLVGARIRYRLHLPSAILVVGCVNELGESVTWVLPLRNGSAKLL
jgi:hypothetical protein